MLHKASVVSRKSHMDSVISIFIIVFYIGCGQTAVNEKITKVPVAALAPPLPIPKPPPSSVLHASEKRPIPENAEPQTSAAMRAIYHLYEECSHADMGFVPCLKKKAILFIDRISRFEAINLTEGVKVVRVPIDETLKPQPVLDELTLASSLSRSMDDRNTFLTDLLLERVHNFLEQHTLQISLPNFSTSTVGRSLEEGRGKMKKMMHMMMMGMAMKMLSMLPIAMGFLYILAGKAFIVAKIAFLLSAIMIVKKLMQSKGGGASSSWPSGNSGSWSSSGGYERRSFAQDLAYRSYNKNNKKSQIFQQQQKQQQHEKEEQQNQKYTKQMAPKQSILPLNIIKY